MGVWGGCDLLVVDVLDRILLEDLIGRILEVVLQRLERGLQIVVVRPLPLVLLGDLVLGGPDIVQVAQVAVDVVLARLRQLAVD